MHAERQAVASCGQLRGNAWQFARPVTANVEDGAEHILFEKVRLIDLGDDRAEEMPLGVSNGMAGNNPCLGLQSLHMALKTG